MQRRTLLLAPLPIAAGLGLAGCGGTGGGSPDGQLNVLVSPHVITSTIEEKLSEFEEANDVTVNLTSLNEDQVSQQLRVEYGAGNFDTDVFLFRPLQDQAQFVNNGWLLDLSEYVEQDGYDWEDFGAPAREASTSREGQIVSVPVGTARQMLFYRKDLFEAAGLTAPPTDLDQLEEYAAKLKSGDVRGVALRGQRAQAVTTFAQFLYAHDGDWNADGEPYGDGAVSSPEAVAALEYYGRILRESGPDGVLNMSWAEGTAQFQQGHVAMYIEGDDRWPEFTDPEVSTLTEDQVGYAPSPARTSVVPAQALGIASGTSKADVAWEFVKWASSKEMAATMQGKGVMGARDSAWEAPETAETFPEDVIAAVQEGNANGVPYDRPRIVKVGEARDAIGNAIAAAIEGGDVATAAESANTTFQGLIDAEKSEFGIS
ncbi:sugar ABC transporter substrate-binding protein [Brachybacterium sp. sponge]|uniref:ABC transporter substrate-binding protein n=1 Tax=Brachybacterium sp. sponge TaxID=1775432 RepID=UPI0007A3FE11|nr:sugar ABC transporter substrate-binding protein [Brachybacterium sp. sponge]